MARLVAAPAVVVDLAVGAVVARAAVVVVLVAVVAALVAVAVAPVAARPVGAVVVPVGKVDRAPAVTAVAATVDVVRLRNASRAIWSKT